MEALQKSPWLNGGCLRGDLDLYLLSPVTPQKLGGRCCSVKLSLKWLSVPVSPPPRSQTTLDLLFMPKASLGAQLCPPPSSYLWCFRPPGSEWETKTVQPLSTASADNRALAAGQGGCCRHCQQMLATTCAARTCTHRALKHSWLQGPARHHQSSAGPASAARAGEPWRGFDTLCLNFNSLIKDFNSAVNSSPNEPRAGHKRTTFGWKSTVTGLAGETCVTRGLVLGTPICLLN